MKILILLLVFLISCESVPPRKLYEPDTKPRKVSSYQIQEMEKTIGYAHRYEWENLESIPRHHYFIYDLEGNLVGFVRGDGLTRAYLPKNNKFVTVGTFSLEGAAAEIFKAEKPVHIFTVTASDVPVSDKILTITSKGSSSKVAKPKKEVTKNAEEDSDSEKSSDSEENNTEESSNTEESYYDEDSE